MNDQFRLLLKEAIILHEETRKQFPAERPFVSLILPKSVINKLYARHEEFYFAKDRNHRPDFLGHVDVDGHKWMSWVKITTKQILGTSQCKAWKDRNLLPVFYDTGFLKVSPFITCNIGEVTTFRVYIVTDGRTCTVGTPVRIRVPEQKKV